MRISGMITIGLLAATFTMTGGRRRLKTEHQNLTAEVANLRNQLADRNSALETCNHVLR